MSARPRGRALRGAPVMYAGTIRHRRFAPRSHAFTYRIAMAWRDLGAAGAGFCPVARCSTLVGEPFDGEIRLLSYPFGFNPVAFYYGYERRRAALDRRPGDEHAVGRAARLRARRRAAGRSTRRSTCRRSWAMDHTYFVRATEPGETLSMHIESRRDGELAFDATLNLRRRPRRAGAPSSRPRCARCRSSTRTASLLKLKGVPHHPHPRTEAS